MPLYQWYQDNASVTIDVKLPRAAILPTQLRMLLAKRRFSLVRTEDGVPFIRRRTYAPIEPRCTDRYTMPAVAPGEPTMVRIVLYKAVQAGWISLFVGDQPGEGLIPSPAPLSHAMAHVAALARSRDAAAREAAEIAASSRALSTWSLSQQTWRSGCHVIKKKTPGGIKIHYGRNAPERATGDAVGEGSHVDSAAGAAAGPDRIRQPWSAVRRHVPVVGAGQEEAAAETTRTAPAAPAAAPTEMEGTFERLSTMAGSTAENVPAKVPSRTDAEAARKAIESVRGGQAPEMPEADSSDDELGGGVWEGEGDDPHEIEYPLPGSVASCDSCAQVVDKYYHCVQCGIVDGFDLCETCKRLGVYSDKHERKFPTHELKLVTKHTAPVMAQQPKLVKAPPAPPAPVPGFKPPGTAISERVIIPLEAKVKYEWSQYSSEVNLSVAIPKGTRARDLIVVVNPFDISISLKGFGVILRGSFHKGMRHRETVWTIEEGMLRILLVKSDGQSWKKLFPSEDEMHPMMAIKQVCDDPEPVSHSYMDLSEEGRSLVDLHRSHRHAMATGDNNYAQELEEEMKMMRFNWGKQKAHMEA